MQGKGAQACRRPELFEIDAAAFADAFARRSVAVHHRLADHPLFTIDAIAELADRLPPESVRREQRQPPARELRLRLRRRRAGPAVGRPIQRRRAHRRQDLAARHPAGARVRGADQRVPGRGRRARRRPRGRHDAPGRLPVHLVPGLDDADALRRRAQLPASGQGHEARERRRRSTTTRSRGIASSTATSTARSATSRRCRPSPRRPSSSPASACTCRRTSRTGSRRRRVSRSRSRSRSTRAYTERAEGVSRINRRLRQLHLSPRPLGASEPVDKTKAAVFRSLQKLPEAREPSSPAYAGSRRRQRTDAQAPDMAVARRGTRTANRMCTCACASIPGIQSGSIRSTGDSRYSLGDSTSTRFRTTASP